nr:expressed protein [Hymenolepis microstoma]
MIFIEPVPKTIHYEAVESGDIAQKLGLDAPSNEIPPCGSLPGGNYFAVARSHKRKYYLYFTKEDYIAYFMNHYFSVKNTYKDREMRPYLIQYKGMPIEALVKFPRLAAIDTQPHEIICAVISKLPHLKLVDMGLSGLFICRRDEYYGIVASMEELLAKLTL